MTRHQALEILGRVWGAEITLTRADAALVQPEERDGETCLATVARIAEVDVSRVQAFDSGAIRHLVALADVQVAKRRM